MEPKNQVTKRNQAVVDFIHLNAITIPRNSLIVLCGPAGSGKSTWAGTHFSRTQVVSSDECRALVSDDPANQNVSANAFDLLHFIIEKRLALGRTTVADATNLKREHRRTLIQIAQRFRFNTVAIVFDIPVDICLSRNADRHRKVPQVALLDQRKLLEKALTSIDKEGFDKVYRLSDDRVNAPVRIGRNINRPLPRPVQ